MMTGFLGESFCLRDPYHAILLIVASLLPILFCYVEPCLVKGQIKKDCAADPSCQTTCVSRFNFGIVCPEICAIAEVNSTQQPLTLCECPDGMIIDEDKNECVTPSDCTPSK